MQSFISTSPEEDISSVEYIEAMEAMHIYNIVEAITFANSHLIASELVSSNPTAAKALYEDLKQCLNK